MFVSHLQMEEVFFFNLQCQRGPWLFAGLSWGAENTRKTLAVPAPCSACSGTETRAWQH